MVAHLGTVGLAAGSPGSAGDIIAGVESRGLALIIAVIGGGKSPPDDIMALADEVGRELGRRGITVACGGHDGVMAAVCKGAKSEGGTTIGILPERDASRANPWVDFPIPTGMGSARNAIIVKTGAAVIAVDGAYGTLSEIGLALGEHIPVIGLKTWELVRDGNVDGSIIVARDAVDAVDKAVEAAERRTADAAWA